MSNPGGSDLERALTQLQTGDFQTRWDVAKVLPGFGTAVIAPLVELLGDPDSDEELQWFIVQILGQFDHPDAVLALTQLLQSETDAELCLTAAQMLGQLGPQAIATLTSLLSDPTTRLPAVTGLAQMYHSQTIPALIQVVDDLQVEVRLTALSALAHFHDPCIPPLLIKGLRDRSPLVRQVAVTGLSFQAPSPEDTDRVAQISPLLADADISVCQSAAQALGRIGSTQAATALFKRLQAADSTALQVSIVRALGWSGNQQAMQYLQQLLQGLPLDSASSSLEIEGVLEAIRVLGQVQDPDGTNQATLILLDLLERNFPILQQDGVKCAIASALGQLGQPQAMPALIQLLAEPDMGLRLHAIVALKQLNSVDPYLSLQQMSDNPDLDPNLAQGVAIALKEWSI